MKPGILITLGILALTVSAMAAEIGGIGLVLDSRKKETEPLRTVETIPGSPAERAGIKPHWYLISVDGTNVVSQPLTWVVGIIRGPVGSSVTLELADAKMSQTNRLTIKRSKMVISEHKVEFVDPK